MVNHEVDVADTVQVEVQRKLVRNDRPTGRVDSREINGARTAGPVKFVQHFASSKSISKNAFSIIKILLEISIDPADVNDNLRSELRVNKQPFASSPDAFVRV